MNNDNEISKIKSSIEDHERRIQDLENFIKEREPKQLFEKDEKGIKELEKKTSVGEEKIKEIYDLDNNSLTITKTLGENDKVKTQNTTLLTLIGYKYLFEKDEILSKEIKRNVAENGIPVNNFATYLNEISPSLIRRKGKTNSPKTTYKLTVVGEVHAKELIKRISEVSNVE